MKNRSPLLPLTIVACIFIAVLLSVGIPKYQKGQSKDAALQRSLWAIRKSVEFYTTDFKKPPKSLQDLVDARYLQQIPVDPFTQSDQTWVIEKKSSAAQPESETGIVDVHSSATGADANGKPYNQY